MRSLRHGRAAAVALAAIVGGAPALAASPPGATSCTGCHGAGSGAPALDGRPASEIAAAMAAFRSGERPGTVMNRIAKGFSAEESAAIAEWFATRPDGGPR